MADFGSGLPGPVTSWHVRLHGYEEGVRAIDELRNAAGRFNGPMVAVGSPLIYAWGIETGRTRAGRLARRAGPANYLRGAMERVMPYQRAAFGRALQHGPVAVDSAITSMGQDLVDEARRLVPVVSGRLQGSIIALRLGRR